MLAGSLVPWLSVDVVVAALRGPVAVPPVGGFDLCVVGCVHVDKCVDSIPCLCYVCFLAYEVEESVCFGLCCWFGRREYAIAKEVLVDCVFVFLAMFVYLFDCCFKNVGVDVVYWDSF